MKWLLMIVIVWGNQTISKTVPFETEKICKANASLEVKQFLNRFPNRVYLKREKPYGLSYIVMKKEIKFLYCEQAK